MPLFDYSLEKLQAYRPDRVEPADFDDFWAKTLAAVREHPLDARFEPYENGLATIDTFDVTFAGWNGERVHGWLQLPRGSSGSLPCVVEYIGYGGGRSLPTNHLLYASAGYAHFVMDSRGHEGADTGDTHVASGGPHVPGFMTDGVLDPQTYYYRRIMSDVVRAVQAARSHPAVDSTRIVAAGGSQGGGLTLAAAGLVPDLLGALPDVPFLCHYRRASEITDKNPYDEISRFCRRQPQYVETVFRTLSYFDGVNFSARANAAALFSVGLMDDVCPPSTVYAAYNNYAGAKDITVWPYNGHEGGSHYQAKLRLDFLAELLN